MIDNIEEPQHLTKQREKLFHPRFELVRMIILVISLILTYIMLSGCAQARERVVYNTVYQDVYIPVKCGISPPERPVKADNPVLATVDIIGYTEALELAFMACVGE